MGIGNLTELTEADTTGVTAMLIGFCQELGIRNVLTTEVIDWARGAVREAVLAAQLMHFAHRARDAAQARRRPAASRSRTRSSARTRRPSCASCRRRSPTRTIRIFADADCDLRLQRRPLRQGHRHQRRSSTSSGSTSATHAFYLGKELMKATIARGPAQELPPGVAARLGLPDVRRAEARARPTHRTAHPKRRRGGNVKKDPDPARHRRAPEHVRRDRRLRRRRRTSCCATAASSPTTSAASCSRRSSPARPDDLEPRRCGSAARAWAPARRCFEEVQKAFFGPFHVSVMLDSNGCNTTAAHDGRAARRGDRASRARRVVIVGAGAVGLRAAKLLHRRGLRRHGLGHPGGPLRGPGVPPRARPRPPPRSAASGSPSPRTTRRSRRLLDGASIVLAAGPGRRRAAARGRSGASVRLDRGARRLQRGRPARHRGHRARSDDMEDYDGKSVLGALAIGGPKMKVHKTCVRRLFETQRRGPRRRRRVRDRQGARAKASARRTPADRAARRRHRPRDGLLRRLRARRRRGRCSRRSFRIRGARRRPRRRSSTRCSPTRRSTSCSARPATACRSSRPRTSASASSR